MCLGVPGQLEEVFSEDGLEMGRVRFSGVARNVCLELIRGGVSAGDYVLVHVGVAISTVDPDEAAQTYAYLQQMGELDGLDATPPASPAAGGKERAP